MEEVRMVIGSWGSYNMCNNRALGSKWLNLSDYTDWEEIEEELKKEGFDLNGIDEELFIQDIEGLPSDLMSWDYAHPKAVFETLRDSDVLSNSYKYETMLAYLECRSWNEFAELVDCNGCRWDDDIHLYKDYDWADYGKEMYECVGYSIPDEIEQFIDFEAYGQYIGADYAYEYDNGIIEIVR